MATNTIATQTSSVNNIPDLGTRTNVQRLLNNQLSNRPSWQTPVVQRMYSNFTYGGNYRMGGTQSDTTPVSEISTPSAESTTEVAESLQPEAEAGLLESVGSGPAVLASIGGQAVGEGITSITQITGTQLEQQQSLAHNAGTESELNQQISNAKTITSDTSIGASIGGIVPVIGAPIGAAIGAVVGAATAGNVNGADLSSPEENAQI